MVSSTYAKLYIINSTTRNYCAIDYHFTDPLGSFRLKRFSCCSSIHQRQLYLLSQGRKLAYHLRLLISSWRNPASAETKAGPLGAPPKEMEPANSRRVSNETQIFIPNTQLLHWHMWGKTVGARLYIILLISHRWSMLLRMEACKGFPNGIPLLPHYSA